MSQNIKPLERKVLILYHGSLQELNSRNPNEQYKFGEHPFFNSEFYPYTNFSLWASQIAEKLHSKGYDGLVNRRTIFRDVFSLEALPQLHAAVEGTPVMRVR